MVTAPQILPVGAGQRILIEHNCFVHALAVHEISEGLAHFLIIIGCPAHVHRHPLESHWLTIENGLFNYPVLLKSLGLSLLDPTTRSINRKEVKLPFLERFESDVPLSIEPVFDGIKI